MRESQTKRIIEKRVEAVVDYIIDNKATLRQTARIFGISKSTIHKDICQRIELLGSVDKINQINSILAYNKAQRYIRGGLATQKKFKFNN